MWSITSERTKKGEKLMIIAGATHIGLIRAINQDAYLILEKEQQKLLLVCDGIGGGKAGDVAAGLATKIFEKAFLLKDSKRDDETQYEWIKQTVNQANEAILLDALTSHHKEGMGTTLVGALISDVSTIIFHLGDSRVYAYYDELICMTQDHNYARDLLKEGVLNEVDIQRHPKRNSLTNALGIWKKYSIDINKIDSSYRYLMLCSDGLYGYVEEKEMINVLKSQLPLTQKISVLIDEANKNGGYDNITLIIVDQVGGKTHE